MAGIAVLNSLLSATASLRSDGMLLYELLRCANPAVVIIKARKAYIFQFLIFPPKQSANKSLPPPPQFVKAIFWSRKACP
jgi:hypothetical protein